MIVEKISELKESRIKQFPSHTNRASELGHECIRYLTWCRTRWNEKQLHDVHTQYIFDEGNLHEWSVLSEIQKVGVAVIEQQRSFEWKEYHITGHIDAKILINNEMIPIEIKSMSQFVFDTIHTLDDMTTSTYPHVRRYPSQMTLYLLMDNKEYGLFILKNKSNGELKEIRIDLDYGLGESLIQKAELINKHIAENTIPDCMEYDEKTCNRCGFYHLCLPEIKRQALEFTLDPEMESKIANWFRLKESKSNYDQLDKEIKETFRGQDKILVGNYLITGKEIKNGWKTTIQDLNKGDKDGRDI